MPKRFLTKKMRVISIIVDVTDLSDIEAEDLRFSMEVQCEGTLANGDDAPILMSAVKEIDPQDYTTDSQ